VTRPASGTAAVGAGTTFRVLLPRAEGEPEEVGAGASSPVRGGREALLLAEDEAGVRTLAARMPRGLGYEVLEAESVEEALAAAERREVPLDLLVADVVLRGGSGRDLAARLAARWPALRVLFVSGYTDDAILRHGVETGSVAFLSKPFAPGALARAVRDALDGAPAPRAATAAAPSAPPPPRPPPGA